MRIGRFGGKRWPVIAAIVLCVGLISTLTVFNVRMTLQVSKLSSEQRKIFNQLQGTSKELRQVAETLNQIGRLPLAYAETPEGLQLVRAEYGASKDDLTFLQRFRGPLLELATNFTGVDPATIKAALKQRITSEFEADPRNLSLAETKRAALITFAMLRVNGSMPTYEVRDSVPNNFKSMVIGTSGNCSDFTLRMMMLAEAIGLKAALISINTPSLPGHVVVDAYDPEEDTAYVLDANFDVRIKRPHAGRQGFFEALYSMSADEQRSFAQSAQITPFPVYFRYVDPGSRGLFNTPLTPEFINAGRSKREVTWRTLTGEQLGELADWWKRTPNHRPRTLAEFSAFLNQIPPAFNTSADYAQRLRAAADVEIESPTGAASSSAK